MITATLTRTRGHHDRCPNVMLTCEDPLEALDHLVSGELAYGEQMTCLSDRFVMVGTDLFDCRDTTAYWGSPDEMRPLVEVATLDRERVTRHRDTIIDAAVACAERLPDQRGRIPRMLSMMAPLWLGAARLNLLVMFACGLPIQDDLEAGSRATLSDVIAAWQLARKRSCSFREALAVSYACE